MANTKRKREGNHKPTATQVSREDVLRLAAEARRTVRCVQAVLEGRSRPLPTQCVVEAATKLGIALPEGVRA